MIKHVFRLVLICSVYFGHAQASDFKHIDFTIAENTVKLYKGAALENLPELTYNLTFKLKTDVEKFRAIYTWVCTNIEGDIYQHDKITRKRKKHKNDSLSYAKWNTNYKKIAYRKLYKLKKTMCTGYAYLIKEMCLYANIDCEIVDGYGRSTTSNITTLDKPNHSWNAVKLNNKWYLCDATWASGYMAANAFFISDYNDGYFLTDPELFAQNHYPLDKKWLLNDKLKASEFRPSPLVYGETFKHEIIPVSPKNMDFSVSKNKEIQFHFKALKSISTQAVSLVRFNGETMQPYKIYNIESKNGDISFHYKFKNRGFYDVHLKIKNDIVATYTIEVVKS